jgi:hypothetical protein
LTALKKEVCQLELFAILVRVIQLWTCGTPFSSTGGGGGGGGGGYPRGKSNPFLSQGVPGYNGKSYFEFKISLGHE